MYNLTLLTKLLADQKLLNYIIAHMSDSLSVSPVAASTPAKRIYSLDVLRGLVMIIMALDHTRDFFHFDAFLNDPMNVVTTTPILYFTRFITHYCAPIFILLAGISIYLQSFRKSKNELSLFLFKRGLWLVFVEVVIITFAWTFDYTYHSLILQVIWAIGICMILMGLIIRLPFNVILAGGVLLVFGHNILDFISSTQQGLFWDLMHNGSFAFYQVTEAHQIVIIYPIIPWIGVMMLGYCLGRIYDPAYSVALRLKQLLRGGIGLLIFFVVLRFLNIYGDPIPWTTYDNLTQTILSFLNVDKYPPSLLFLCVTLGPALIFLSLFETINNKLTQAISVYGRVPFFYYILHFYFIHIICMFLFVNRGHHFNDELEMIFGMQFRYLVVGEGYSLGIVYLIWAFVVIALYPLCKWFSDLKQQRKHWWLSYL